MEVHATLRTLHGSWPMQWCPPLSWALLVPVCPKSGTLYHNTTCMRAAWAATHACMHAWHLPLITHLTATNVNSVRRALAAFFSGLTPPKLQVNNRPVNVDTVDADSQRSSHSSNAALPVRGYVLLTCESSNRGTSPCGWQASYCSGNRL